MESEKSYFSSPNGMVNAPSFLVQSWDLATGFLAAYGWYILGTLIAIAYFWPSIRSYLDKRYEEKSSKEYDAKCKKDPDWLQRRRLEMETARLKMQEDLSAKAALHAEKMKQKEEQARAEFLASTSSAGGNRLGDSESSNTNPSRTTLSSKKTYRPEYNPLMGGGGSGGYRPPRRGCPGGGCG